MRYAFKIAFSLLLMIPLSMPSMAQDDDAGRGEIRQLRRHPPVNAADQAELRSQRRQPTIQLFKPGNFSTEPDEHNDERGSNEPEEEPSQQTPSDSADDTPLLGAALKPIQEMDWGAVFEPAQRAPRLATMAPATSPWRDPYFGSSQDLTYTWAARNLAHRTLYFEDMPLERYGQSCGEFVQPVKSAARFLADSFTMPLQWLREKPCELHYVLGLDRAGNCSCPVQQRIVPHGWP